MRNVHEKKYFWFMTLVLFLTVPTLARAGQGSEKPKPGPGAPAKKSCFTLLNAKKIPAGASTEVRLATARVDAHIDGQTPREIFTQFGKTIGVQVVLAFDTTKQKEWNDPKACKNLGGTVRNVAARGYLDYMFSSLSLEGEYYWLIREGKLIVFKGNPEVGGIHSKVYKVTSLLAPPKQGQVPGDGPDDLIEAIKATIDPEDWSEVGGAGTIASSELIGAKVLVVRSDREVHEQIEALIATFEQILAQKKSIVSRSICHEASRRRFRQAMAQKVTIDANETPLTKVVASIRKQTKQPVIIDRDAIINAGREVDSPVTYRSKDRPLRAFHDEALYDLDLTWMPRFDMILVTSKEVANSCLDTVIFEVTDLTKISDSGCFDYDQLIDLIKATVEPENWSEVGGMGTIAQLSLQGRSFLVLRQTEDAMTKIEQLLDGLHAIQIGKTVHCPPVSKADREVLKKLKKKITWQPERDTTLKDFFAELSRKSGVDSDMDENAIMNSGSDVECPIGSPTGVKDNTVETLVNQILDPLDLAWYVRHGKLVITSEEVRDCLLSIAIHEVSDLTVYTDTQKNKSYDLDSLQELIKTTVAPEYWSEVGGNGSIDVWSSGDRHALVIRQSEQVQRDVTKLLADLRAAMPKDPAKRIPPVRVKPLFPKKPEIRMFGDGVAQPRDAHPDADTKQPEKVRKLPKNLPPAGDPGEPKLVASNNALAIKLYTQMAKTQMEKKDDGRIAPKSFCFSPYSIASLTQAVKVGTRGETDKQLKKALCLSLFGDDLHRAHGSLLTSLLSDTKKSYTRVLGGRGGYSGMPAPVALPSSSQVPRPFELTIANRLWIQKEAKFPLLPEFCKILKQYYLCDIEEINFNNREKSAQQINRWVSKQTQNRIREIISPNDINNPPPTRFIAANAVFFKGIWKTPFQVKDTKPKPFYHSDGKTKLHNVSMMSMADQICNLGYLDRVSILRKPYKGDASFMVLLPPPGRGELEKLQASLSVDNLRKWIQATRPQKLTRLELPKFELGSDFKLIPIMEQLDVKDLFKWTGANFMGMVSPDSPWSQEPLFIYLMRHKATLELDEEGTVAAAVTAMGGAGGCLGMEPRPVEFVADRPFLFLILDEKTAGILFMGRYMGPDKDAEEPKRLPPVGVF